MYLRYVIENLYHFSESELDLNSEVTIIDTWNEDFEPLDSQRPVSHGNSSEEDSTSDDEGKVL